MLSDEYEMDVDDKRTYHLDSKWIEDYEKMDKSYGELYTEDVRNMNIFYVYLNEDKNIKSVTKEDISLINVNCLTQEELIRLIKNNNILHGKHYSLNTIMKYNYDINPNDIITYSGANQTNHDSYLTEIVHIEDINFNKTIGMYLDLNVLYIIFAEKKTSNEQNKTKRIYFKNHKRTMRKKM